MSNLDFMLAHYDIVLICEYCGKLVISPCIKGLTGYYPDFRLRLSYETEYKFLFPKIIGCKEYNDFECNVDGIIFIKTDEGIQIHCVEDSCDSCDGYEIITEKR